MSVPTSSETTIVRGREHRAGVRQLEPERAEQRLEPLREPEAEDEPDDRREEADHERLEQHGAEHLPPRGAERPQRRELARPLRDRDRERVEDHERADEERDPGEGEQEVADEGRELADVVLGASCASCAPVLHLRVGRQQRLDLGDELLGRRRPPRPRRRSRRTAPRGRRASAPSRRRRSRTSRSPIDLTSPYCAMPDDLEVLLRLRASRSRSSRRRAKPSRSAVPASTTTSPAPCGQRPSSRLSGLKRVLGRGVDAEAEARRAVRVDRLPVLADDLRVALVVDAAHREPDAVEPADARRAATSSTGGASGGSLEVDGDVAPPCR